MIIVTGGAGFIGSNIVKALNAVSYTHLCQVVSIPTCNNKLRW